LDFSTIHDSAERRTRRTAGGERRYARCDGETVITNVVHVKAVFALADGVQLEFAPAIELSLSCATCQRGGRTVHVREDGATCVKTGHPFDARVTKRRVERVRALTVAAYHVQYAFSPFFDPKFNRPAERIPTWGRISFTATCPACGATSRTSTQTNTVRPHQECCRECGHAFYEDVARCEHGADGDAVRDVHVGHRAHCVHDPRLVREPKELFARIVVEMACPTSDGHAPTRDDPHYVAAPGWVAKRSSGVRSSDSALATLARRKGAARTSADDTPCASRSMGTATCTRA